MLDKIEKLRRFFTMASRPWPTEPSAPGRAEGISRRPALAADQDRFGIALETAGAAPWLCPSNHLLRLKAPGPGDYVSPINMLVDDPQIKMGFPRTTRPQCSDRIDVHQLVITLGTGSIGSYCTADRIGVKLRPPRRIGDNRSRQCHCSAGVPSVSIAPPCSGGAGAGIPAIGAPITGDPARMAWRARASRATPMVASFLSPFSRPKRWDPRRHQRRRR